MMRQPQNLASLDGHRGATAYFLESGHERSKIPSDPDIPPTDAAAAPLQRLTPRTPDTTEEVTVPVGKSQEARVRHDFLS
jgi:hypothetical protein